MSSPAIALKVRSGDPIQVCSSTGAHALELMAGRWAVTYTTLLQKKIKEIHSGNILLHFDCHRLVLLDDNGVTVDAKTVSINDCISVGMSMEFPCHLVCWGTDLDFG
jgi:hypothetical protein